MKITQIEKALYEAVRFSTAASQAIRAIKAVQKEQSAFYPIVSKDVASCRRASLDLSRVLAEMRK